MTARQPWSPARMHQLTHIRLEKGPFLLCNIGHPRWRHRAPLRQSNFHLFTEIATTRRKSRVGRITVTAVGNIFSATFSPGLLSASQALTDQPSLSPRPFLPRPAISVCYPEIEKRVSAPRSSHRLGAVLLSTPIWGCRRMMRRQNSLTSLFSTLAASEATHYASPAQRRSYASLDSGILLRAAAPAPCQPASLRSPLHQPHGPNPQPPFYPELSTM